MINNVSQTATISVGARRAALLRQLADARLSSGDLQELEAAIDADAGALTNACHARWASASAHGSARCRSRPRRIASVGSEVVGGVVTASLLGFFGLGD